MGREKCRLCKHYVLEWSGIYKSYAEGCKYTGPCNNGGCKGKYEPKQKLKAYIKRRI